jgi:Domain of unknown function (DUF4288)
MGDVPGDARWFLADLVVEHRIEGDPRNVVHINTVLVRAGSAEDAYSKALALGEEEKAEYENTDGRMVTVLFRGLGNLFDTYEGLEHGSELIYSEEIGLPEEQVMELVSSKESLAVFTDRPPIGGPNYMPKEIYQVIKALGECQINNGIQRQDDRL